MAEFSDMGTALEEGLGLLPSSRADRSGRAANRATAEGVPTHPNQVDRKRIERALEQRMRYRYVTPSVHEARDGYRITSPCCSRRIRSDGGVIDIAWLQYIDSARSWGLFRKDHERSCWELRSQFASLMAALDELIRDPEHVYWQ
jgi:hypothetical protein